MSLNYDALFREMAKQPQVKQAVKAKAEKLKDYIETRWPDVNDLPERDRAFLQGNPGEVVKITESTRSNRPTHVVTVRHPGAVAKQAKTGFLTKAVKDVR